MYYYEVAPRKIVRSDSAVLTYESDQRFQPGTLVQIPVGAVQQVGIVMRAVPRPAYATKPIGGSIEVTALPSPLLSVAVWMADYYATHFATVLQTLLPRNLTTKRRVGAQKVNATSGEKRTHFLLNGAQQAAVTAILAQPSGTTLLKGITGSGKTAVYVELAQQAVHAGKSAMIIVPEIALTSQLIHVFSEHFDDLLVTHSRMTEAQRHRVWKQALGATEPRVVIGPRSALFLPLQNIGLIVIDEAHEPSLKQEQAPRYHAARVASILASAHRARLVLGSATPLITDYYLAQRQPGTIVRMDETARLAQKPTVQLVDMTKKHNFKRHRFFSEPLLQHIAATLAAGNQVLLFHNRRGTTPTTLCENCGWTATCPRCFLPLTLHGDKHQLRCHVCNYTERVPTQCPVCSDVNIIHKGIGTKLIEAEIRKLFPQATIQRFDGDSDNTSSVDQLYTQLHDGSIDIIIGTQVVAKGLDLPHLRTVGVIQADAGLSLPDFSAAERTFQLVSQVVGRVGRSDHATTAIIQSYQPSHPAITCGIAQDYETFYRSELAVRKKAQFPPFTYLLKLTCIYKTEAAAVRNARNVAAQLRAVAPPHVTFFGPTPSFYERVGDTYRWQLVVKSPKRADLAALLEHIPATYWQSELDPISLL